MDFDLTEDQKEIKSTAREVLAARSTWEAVREAAGSGRYDERLRSEIAELGWPGIAVAEEHGGLGLGAVELAVLLEEVGYACAATPLLGSVLAAQVIGAAGSAEQQARWLPGLASGELLGGVGTAELCADAPGADVVVLVEADGSASLLAQADATVTAVATIDPTRAYGRVEGDGEALAGDVARAADLVRGAVTAEVVGICQRALDMTLDYVKDRRQFGTPVGAFQAVSHRCAQMLLHTESARSTSLFAAWAAGADPERLPEAAALAAAAAAEAGKEVTASAIQAHGGVGFTWEADVHWLYKRAQLDAALLGGTRRHRAELARIAAQRLAAPAGT